MNTPKQNFLRTALISTLMMVVVVGSVMAAGPALWNDSQVNAQASIRSQEDICNDLLGAIKENLRQLATNRFKQVTKDTDPFNQQTINILSERYSRECREMPDYLATIYDVRQIIINSELDGSFADIIPQFTLDTLNERFRYLLSKLEALKSKCLGDQSFESDRNDLSVMMGFLQQDLISADKYLKIRDPNVSNDLNQVNRLLSEIAEKLDALEQRAKKEPCGEPVDGMAAQGLNLPPDILESIRKHRGKANGGYDGTIIFNPQINPSSVADVAGKYVIYFPLPSVDREEMCDYVSGTTSTTSSESNNGDQKSSTVNVEKKPCDLPDLEAKIKKQKEIVSGIVIGAALLNFGASSTTELLKQAKDEQDQLSKLEAERDRCLSVSNSGVETPPPTPTFDDDDDSGELGDGERIL